MVRVHVVLGFWGVAPAAAATTVAAASTAAHVPTGCKGGGLGGGCLWCNEGARGGKVLSEVADVEQDNVLVGRGEDGLEVDIHVLVKPLDKLGRE